jgi:hypothetical protein
MRSTTTLLPEIRCCKVFGRFFHDVVEHDIVGHYSEVVSRGYTHLSADDTADSMSKLPDVTQ